MKYNPSIDEEMASLPGFTNIHPLQSEDTVQGALEVLARMEEKLSAITGLAAFTFQPAAGAHGEFTGLLVIKAQAVQNGHGKHAQNAARERVHHRVYPGEQKAGQQQEGRGAGQKDPPRSQ